jgi:CheY-like chemotaxis protein
MEKKKLLLIDDVELFLNLQISFLGRTNFDIHTASSGTEGLAKAHELKPDLIVLDYVMEDMMGPEVCEKIRQSEDIGDTRIIIMSSRYGEDALNKCMEAGCNAFLYKPVRRESFINTVEEQLDISLRRYERADTSLSCTINGRGQDSDSTIYSLSASGAFVEYSEAVSPGDLMELQFLLPGYHEELKMKASVVWTGNLGDNNIRGVGLEFVESDTAYLELIRRYVAAREGQW